MVNKEGKKNYICKQDVISPSSHATAHEIVHESDAIARTNHVFTTN